MQKPCHLVVTHRKRFHADEAMGVAILEVAGLNLQVDRIDRHDTRLHDADYKLDIGHRHAPEDGFFDHHQPAGAGRRNNGVPFATAGLVWQHFGMAICAGDAALFKTIDQELMLHLDAADNGEKLHAGTPPVLSTLIARHNGDDVTDDADQHTRFLQAVAMCRMALENSLRNAKKEQERLQVVQNAINAYTQAGHAVPRALPLDRVIEWRDTKTMGLLNRHGVDALVMNAGNDVHMVHLVNRKLAFPPRWVQHHGQSTADRVVITTRRHARVKGRETATRLLADFLPTPDTRRMHG